MNKFILTTLLTTIFYSNISLSETMYIDDTLLVPLRSGEGTSFRIIHKGLKSGLKLEIIKQDTASGYSKIRTPSGIEGFLPTRYLSRTPIARNRLIDANKALNKTRAENGKLKTKLANISAQYKKLSSEHTLTSKSLTKNNKELSNIKSISANALNLDKRNRELRESNEQLRSDLELIETENRRLKDKSDSSMLLIGGGLVTLGIILALIIPIIRPSKKSDSWA